jgi:hypothetical protein
MAAGPVAFKSALGNNANNVSGTTLVITTTNPIAIGDFVVVRVAADNTSATAPTFTCADSGGNTYTNQIANVNGTSTAGSGVAGAILTRVATAAVATGGTITVTLSPAAVGKAAYAEVFTGVDTDSGFGFDAASALGATTAASVATATAQAIPVGALVLGACATETRTVPTADSDTLNGSWSAQVTRAGGGTSGQDATSVSAVGQYKIVTAAGQQTYNITTVAAEWVSLVVVFRALPPPAITQAASQVFAEGSETTSVALAAQDTTPSVSVVSDANVQLRVRLQAGADAVLKTTDFKLQYAKNAGAWTDVGSNPALLTTWPFSQYDSWVKTDVRSGQSFTGNGEKLSRMAFDIHRLGTPPGTYTAVLYAHSGTFGTSSVGTGAALATSTTVLTPATLSGYFGWVFFDFDGTFTLVNGTNYVMAIVATNAGDASNCVEMVVDFTSPPSRAGNRCDYNGTTWTAQATYDYMTRVYTVPATPPTTVVGHYVPTIYNGGGESALCEGQPTSQRLSGGTGSFVAGTQSMTGLQEGVGWSANNYTELLFALTLKSANLVNNDTLTFRVLRNGAADLTYSVTPTIKAVTGPPPIDLVVDNATHATTSTGPGGVYYDPQIAVVKTSDPGPLPNEWTWRFKISGPTNITQYGTSTTIASQGNDSGGNQGWYLSRSSEAIDPSITTDGDIYTNYAFVSNGNALPGWSMGVSNGAPPTGSPEVFAIGASQIALGYWGYRSTDDGASWTYINGYTWGGSEPAYDSPESVIIGSANGWTPTGNTFAGRIYWLEMRTGSDPAAGTLLWRFDASEYVSGTSWVDARGRTWTLTDPAGIVVAGTPLVLTETVVPTLVVQSAAHAHAADNTVLTQVIVTTLAVQGAVHAPTAATVALGVDLVVQGAAHASTAANAAIEVLLVVQAATHTPVSDNVVLTQISSTTLVVANATHAVISGYGTGGAVSPYLFSEDWNVPDQDHWDWAKWPVQRPYYTISGNKGIVTPSGGPSVASSDKYVTDFEMTVKVEWQTANPNYPEICWRLYDGLGGYAASSGYVAQVAPAGRVDLYKVGAYTSIGNFTDASLNAAGVRWWKVRVVGTSHKVKWWNDGSAEPGTWQIDATDSSPQTDTQGAPIVGGAIGFRSYGSPPTIVDDLTVVDLASPPLPVTDGSMRMLSNGKAIALNGNSNAFPSDTDLSWCGWVRYEGRCAISTDVWSLFSGGSTYCSTSVAPDGSIRQYMDTGDFSAGYTVPLNTWVFLAMSRSITGGTDLYWAPQGTSTLSTVHNASKGTITGLKLRVLSGEYGSNPYSMGCAFKCWTAALTQAQLEAEMTTYAVQRTANLFLHYSMRNGMFYAPDNDPLNDQKWIWWEQGAIVSGPVATHLLDAPVPPAGGIIDVPLVVDLVVQSATHAPVADNVVLFVPSTNLVVQDAAHAHTAANVALGVDLVVGSAAHAVTDNAVLNYVVLAPADALHAPTAASPFLVVDLAAQAAIHAPIADSVTLNYVVLAPADAIHATLSDNVGLGASLTVADALHAHATDNVSLGVDLVVQAAGHLPLADNVVVENVVVAQGATHAHAADAPTLYAVPMLVVAAAVHAVADNALLAVDLYPQGSTHASAADGVVLNYVVLAAADAAHASVAQAPILGVDPAVQGTAHAVTSPDVLLVVDLVVQGASHAQITDNVTLQMQGDLAIQSALHNQVTDNVGPLNINMDGVQGAVHASVADTVTNSYNLATQDAVHAHAADNTIITPALVVGAAQHASVADNVTFTLANNVVVQDAAHAVTDNLALFQVHNLTVADAVHASTVASPDLGQIHNLAMDSALHASVATTISLAGGSTLLVADSAHLQSAEVPAITQVHVITAADGLLAHSAGNVVLYAVPMLVVADAVHAQTASDVAYTQIHNLAIDSAFHAHTAEIITLVFSITLILEAAFHAHTAGSPGIREETAIVLNYADAIFLGDRAVDRVYVGAVQVWP